MKKDKYEYEIYNCFGDAVAMVKSEQQAISLVKTLQEYYGSTFSYKYVG